MNQLPVTKRVQVLSMLCEGVSLRSISRMDDVKNRLSGRVQITTDGLKAYMDAVEGAFGADVDYAMLVKLYGEAKTTDSPERKYSPSECIGTRTYIVSGDPDADHISTSHV